MAKKNFYAVKAGRVPGIYKTWAECEQQTKGFTGAKFKGFVTQPEAEAFAGVVGIRAAVVNVVNAVKVSASAGATSGTSYKAAPKRSRAEAFGGGGSAGTGAGAGVSLEGAVNLAIYTDGSCFGNQNVRVKQQPAGWSAVVVRLPDQSKGSSSSGSSGGGGKKAKGKQQVALELFGPVVTPGAVADRPELAPFSLRAEVGSNNTGELCGIAEALVWVRDHAPPSARKVDIRYDSKYAAMSTTGVFNGAMNRALILEARKALTAAQRVRTPPKSSASASSSNGDDGSSAKKQTKKANFSIFAKGGGGGGGPAGGSPQFTL